MILYTFIILHLLNSNKLFAFLANAMIIGTNMYAKKEAFNANMFYLKRLHNSINTLFNNRYKSIE